MFFIHGDADGVRLAHIAEMFRLKGGEIHGDLKPRSASRLAILPDTTHRDTDAAHAHHRPNGEWLSRRQAVAVLRLAPFTEREIRTAVNTTVRLIETAPTKVPPPASSRLPESSKERSANEQRQVWIPPGGKDALAGVAQN